MYNIITMQMFEPNKDILSHRFFYFTGFRYSMMAGFKIQRLWPKSSVDKIAFGFTMTELIVEGSFELFIVIPKLYPELCVGKVLHAFFGAFLFFNTVGNLFLAMGTDVTSGSTVLPSILKPGWKYCSTCILWFSCYKQNSMFDVPIELYSNCCGGIPLFGSNSLV